MSMFNRNKFAEGAPESSGRQPARTPGDSLIAKPQRPDIPGFQRPEATPRKADAEPQGSKLTVGRDIHLKGEITSCDVLVVEGKVEAAMNSRYLAIAENGVFKGDCEVDTADISGRFEGNLAARKRLIVRASGHVTGTIRYGEIEIEAGGVISGDVQMLEGRRGKSGGPREIAEAAHEPGEMLHASSAAE